MITPLETSPRESWTVVWISNSYQLLGDWRARTDTVAAGSCLISYVTISMFLGFAGVRVGEMMPIEPSKLVITISHVAFFLSSLCYAMLCVVSFSPTPFPPTLFLRCMVSNLDAERERASVYRLCLDPAAIACW